MVIRLALFDVLEGRFGGRVPVETVSEEDRRVHSVVGHLQRLLNTRQGSVPHIPDYGLPDPAEARRRGDDALDQLRKAVRDAIVTYEPRLARVRVEAKATDAAAMRTTFVITGEVERGRRVRLETTFGSQEPTAVRPA
ncbi:type VI secretion system baseplate subunit TssE [Rubrivirga sp. IMCC43871]|uniref:type VI secretion system baseplate subunit TssE n=1 Tax=Rubrivirga sp. IMCC43871 TaxID=3391575 RepID=UPI00398F9C75